MPPRKNPTTTNPDKGKGKGKGKEKAASTSKKPETKSKKRAAPSPDPDEPPKPWEKGLRSKAARERDRFKLSRASLDSENDITEEQLNAFANSLTGGSRDTWGTTRTEPLQGARKKRQRGPAIVNPNLSSAAREQFLATKQSPKQRVAIPNDPDRSPILRTSMEIRERIYDYLFVHKRSIVVKYTWEEGERNSYEKNTHQLIFVSKQFAVEVPAFIFRNNTIKALLRIPTSSYRLNEGPRLIPSAQFANFRNIILDCSKDCWNLDWFEKASNGLAKVAEGKPEQLNTLTLVVTPQRVMRSTTALGIENSPITFADFLWWEGAFMQVVLRLAPKTFKIVVKKGVDKALWFSVDMSLFRLKPMEIGPLANVLTVQNANKKSLIVEEKLRGLKDLFEEIFEDDETVQMDGRCTLMPVEQKVIVKEKDNRFRRISQSQVPVGAEIYTPKARVNDDTVALTNGAESGLHFGSASFAASQPSSSAENGIGFDSTSFSAVQSQESPISTQSQGPIEGSLDISL